MLVITASKLLRCDFGPVFHREFPWLCVWEHRLAEAFHRHHPGRWQQIYIRNVSVHFSIHPSFNNMKCACAVCWRTAPHMMIPPPTFPVGMVFWGWCAVPSDSRSFCSSPQVLLGSGTTLLTILSTPLSEILRGAPGCGQLMVKNVLVTSGLWPQQCSMESSAF